MSQRLSTTFVNTNIPGTYVNYNVITQPVGVSSSGIAVLLGEADGGPSYKDTTLANSLYSPAQLDKVTQTFVSGQLVDGFTAITSPSNDANITGTATLVYAVKTNQGTKATATLPSYGTLTHLNWGVLGNQDQYQILAVDAEVAPTITGNTIPAFGTALNGDSFSIRLNGGASSTVTLSTTASDHDTISHLVTELNQYTFTVTSAGATAGATYSNNGQTFTVVGTIVAGTTLLATGTGAPLPSGTLTKVSGAGDATITYSASTRLLPNGIAASAGIALNTLVLTMSPDSTAWANGWGKSFELIDSIPGDLAALGLTAGLNVSSQEPAIEIQDSNIPLAISETLVANASVALEVGYAGTTGTLTIASGMLTTTVTGGTGGNLSITLSQYSTIGQVATFIAAQPGYSSAVVPAATQLPTSALDDVAAIGIASTSAGDEPGRIKTALYNFEQVMATSRLLTFTATATSGLPTPMTSPAFLAGGARGATLASDIVDSVDKLSSINCNIMVPLFSQNASADIAAGLTSPDSTYTIAAINAIFKNNCIENSNPSLNKNRTCILSNNGTFAASQIASQGLASYRCSLTFQGCTQVNSAGVITSFQPWYSAVIGCGMQLGGFYKNITNKYANIISIIDPSDYNSGDPGDTSEALNAGLLPLYTDVGGPKWVSDQTTYTADSNFVYNSIQAVYNADLIAIDLKQSFTNAFVGQSLADVSAASASAFLTQKMAGYLQLKLLAPSNGVPLGFNNAKISISAPIMSVSVNIYLDTAIYFIPIQFSISAVQQSA